MKRATVIRGYVAFAVGLGLPCTAMATPTVTQVAHHVVVSRAAADPVVAAYQAMTPGQRIGQLFMAGVRSGGPSAAKLARLHRLGVGNVILNGNSSAGAAAVAVTAATIDSSLSRSGAAPFIATDQEGGQVQRLTGPGFSAMPTALEQGQWSAARLRRESATWAQQLAAAGVNLNLAPVADIVPARHAHANQPIGRYDREYGHTEDVVGPHVAAVVRGESAHVAVTVKHFPGLGRATGNTDLAKHVTDPTTRHDPYLAAFQSGVSAGAPFVMVSLATYPNIDPDHPACFSSVVPEQMLRHDLGFDGVVISDSFHAVAVRSVPPGTAAVRFFRAGGTMLLDTDASPIHDMAAAVRARAETHPVFAATIKADVLDVLQAKSDAGLLATVQQ
ncbi:MAG TPA: glycoside hydrolase family 3 N-terminal domain-containing protein [Mycobacteriales bacterium]|nr:glycoside hydrolase family 3 N-terminal domain-containing protein [Mycobacteriales bacterium]